MNSRRTRSRSLGWKGGLALVLVLLAGAFTARAIYKRFQVAHNPNSFYEVKRADMLISVSEEGALRALNETVVRSSLEGLNRIIHLVPEGSYVEKGDLLVELDSSGLRERLNQEELLYQDRLFQVQQARGNLAIQKSMVESQIKDAELRVENAIVDFEKYRDGDAPLLIKTVEARTSVISEQVRIARERYTRTEELFKAGNATRSEVEADALTLKREQLALGQYQEDLRLIQKYDKPNQLRLLQSNVEQAKAELVRLKQRTSNEIAQAEADLKTGQGALDFMEEGLDMLKERLKSTKIVAPQNGLVVYAQVSPFQFGGGDERRMGEGRSRFGRDGGGGGDFRGGGGRRGNRGGNNSETSSRNGASGGSTVADTIASGNQRIASAISGSPVTDSGAGGGGGGSSGGRSGGSSGGGSGSASSAVGAFASYSSMRPASLLGAATATNAPASSAASSGAALANTSPVTPMNAAANQFGFRSSQNSRGGDFGMEIYGSPGMLEEGIMVRQRQELIRLPDVTKMLAEIKVEEARVAQVRPGMTAYISVRNIPHHRFKGTVRRVALLPDAQSAWLNPEKKVFPTDILVEEELPILKPGVTANVEVIITNLTKVLSVPIQTVARLEGESVCFVKRGRRVVPVSVTTGWYNDAFIEVTSGLKEGDFVLLAPIGDKEEVEEEMDEAEAGETNKTAPAAAPPQSQRPPAIEEPGQERRSFQRRGADSADGEMPSERPRGRGGFGRRQNSEESQNSIGPRSPQDSQTSPRRPE